MRTRDSILFRSRVRTAAAQRSSPAMRTTVPQQSLKLLSTLLFCWTASLAAALASDAPMQIDKVGGSGHNAFEIGNVSPGTFE
jgi:hypothetical protein